ncbi:MAG: hypothetical protein EKK42_00200 [Pseudonocardiaceae bacterium]|nr:MAG: hypothetical protein EKK42_00200 [Pseudonocardiaceae bacterium]
MPVTFPGESSEYRAARDRLLEQEAELRRLTETARSCRTPDDGAQPPGCPDPRTTTMRSRAEDRPQPRGRSGAAARQ